MKWRVLNPDEFETYEKWAVQQPSFSWFQSVQAFESVLGRQPDIWVTEENGHFKGGYACIPVQKAGLTYPKRHPLLYLSAPVVDHRADYQKVLNSLGRQFSFSLHQLPFQAAPYPQFLHLKSATGLIIPLNQSMKELESGFHSMVKRQLKKPFNGDIQWVSPAEMTTQVLSWYPETYRHHGKNPPVSSAALEQLMKKLNADTFKMVAAYKEGQPVAWRLWIKDHRGAWIDWMSALNRQLAENAGVHLMKASIEKAMLENVPFLDMGGTNTPGIAEFKQRFGGHTVYGGRVILAQNILIRMLINVKDAYRQRQQQLNP